MGREVLLKIAVTLEVFGGFIKICVFINIDNADIFRVRKKSNGYLFFEKPQNLICFDLD